MSALVEIIRHDSWANVRLIEFCQALPSDMLQASAPGTYGSITATRVHLLAAEERYRSLISGQRPDDPLKEGREPQSDELRARVESLAAFWDEQARDPRRLERMIPSTWRRQEHTIKASVAVIQMINHGNEHRAQISTILGQRGIEPPALDGWAYAHASGLITSR